MFYHALTGRYPQSDPWGVQTAVYNHVQSWGEMVTSRERTSSGSHRKKLQTAEQDDEIFNELQSPGIESRKSDVRF